MSALGAMPCCSWGERGASLRRNNWGKSAGLAKAVKTAGLPVGFHFHNLLHTGNHLAAASGASTRELMPRWAIECPGGAD